jgi:hypothetical protein
MTKMKARLKVDVISLEVVTTVKLFNGKIITYIHTRAEQFC